MEQDHLNTSKPLGLFAFESESSSFPKLVVKISGWHQHHIWKRLEHEQHGSGAFVDCQTKFFTITTDNITIKELRLNESVVYTMESRC